MGGRRTKPPCPHGVWAGPFALSAQIDSERLYGGRFGHHAGPAPAGYPLHQAGKVLPDVAISGRIVRKADGGRRPKAIWEIPDHRIFLALTARAGSRSLHRRVLRSCEFEQFEGAKR